MRVGTASFGALVLLLAGCTAVPSHSAPQVISPIAVNPAPPPSGRPPPAGASPREIVQDFLDASAEEAGAQSSSREYLTRNARGGWQDFPVTVLDSISVGNFSPPPTTITVTGRVIGQVNEAGIYSPSRLGTGSGGPINSYVFHIKKVRGQYRIDRLQQQGLLLSLDQFSTIYESHALEFFNLAEHYLVPDERYSPLHGVALADWLLGQLAAGPRPELQNAVSAAQGLPSPANGTPPTVHLGEVTKVAVPGAAQLPMTGRDRLAAQIGRTLVDVVNNGLLSITDGGKAIEIPAVGSNEFAPAQFDARVGPPQPPPLLYYVRDGRVVREDGTALAGNGVDASPHLDSVAVTTSALDPNSLSVAGTVISSDVDRLWVGTQQLGLRRTTVLAHVSDPQHLPLTRPAWAPGRSEVWIGAGGKLYRLSVSGVAAQQHLVPLGSAANDARVRAVRISPDGSRIALVLGAPGASLLYEGAIVRTAGRVRVDGLNQISPNGVVITDVAWLDPLKLFAIGYLKSNTDSEVCETNVDGSAWSMRGVPGLPPSPDALTITTGQLAWVSVNDTVWRQSGDSDIWVSPSGTGFDQVPGSNPVYLE